MPVRKVAEFLDNDPSLIPLARVARRAAELQHVYLDAVPAELAQASRVGWVRPGVLHVAAANGAVAAKLRHLAPRILDRFSREGFEFNAMRVEVQVGLRPPSPNTGKAKLLSANALAAITQAAQELSESPLKTALGRFARAARRRHSTRSKT